MTTAAGHPPAPWRLQGRTIIVPALVPIERARAEIHADVEIVPVAPGMTAGGLIAVTYEPGSTLNYSELIACAGLVRSGSSLGGWISHIWVDDEQSVSGGRSIWKLPKELATFSHERRDDGTQSFFAAENGVTLVRLAAAAPRFRAPVPGFTPMVSGSYSEHFFTLGRGRVNGGPARVRAEIPADSPLAPLGLQPAPIALAGDARLVMDVAKRITAQR